MDLPTSGDFWLILSAVVSVLGLFLALRADLRKEIRNLRADMEKRFDQVDRQFGQVDRQFGGMEKQFGRVDKRFEQVDKRFEQVDKRFEQVDKQFEQVGKQFEQMGHRIDRIEDRARENHKEVIGELAKMKAEVSAMGAKLDERSYPRRLETVRETRGEYSDQKPEESGVDPDGGDASTD